VTNYPRLPNDHIHAGLALHAGLLLDQYEGLTRRLSSKHKYEATLTIAVLQMLLTNFTELLERLRDELGLLSTPIGDAPVWGLERAFVQQNTFPEPLTLSLVVRNLRNALSHPTSSEKTEWPDTGYTSPRDPALVDAFRFTHSPWVENGVAPTFPNMKVLRRKIDGLERWDAQYDASFQLSDGLKADGRYVVTRDGEPYAPIFTIEIPLKELKIFTKELATFIAQPVDEEWIGAKMQTLSDLLLIEQARSGS
jgi:hypothetical protein